MSACDVAIIGGGPAGLSAALTLARARRSAMVLDADRPRNASSLGVQGFLSRDGIPPSELKRMARAEIEAYGGINFLNLAARKITRLAHDDHFLIDIGEPIDIRATFVVLTPGMIDQFPDIEGLRAHWGRDVIHCEFCHGWENSDRRWVAIVSRTADLDAVDRLLNWTNDITAIVNPDADLPRQTIDRIAGAGIFVEQGMVRRLVTAGDRKLTAVQLADRRIIPCRTLLLQPDQEQAQIVLDAGLEVGDDNRVIVDAHYETSVAGIFAGGDVTPGPQTALSAAATGAAIGRRLAFLLATGRIPACYVQSDRMPRCSAALLSCAAGY